MFVKIMDELWVNPEHVVAVQQPLDGGPTKVTFVDGTFIDMPTLSLMQVLLRLGGGE